MGSEISNYSKTKAACYLGFVTQAIVANQFHSLTLHGLSSRVWRACGQSRAHSGRVLCRTIGNGFPLRERIKLLQVLKKFDNLDV